MIPKVTRRRFMQASAAAGGAALLPSLLTGCNHERNHEPADILLENGTFHLDVRRSTGALALRRGVVIATGREALSAVGRDTKRIDLAARVGGTAHIFPGFHDSHMHLLDGAFLAGRLKLMGVGTQEDLRNKVKDYIQVIDPQGTGNAWVVGMGWRFSEPSGVSLDDLTGQHPIFLVDASGHSVLVNTLALQAANVNDNTLEPVGGELVKDAQGHLTGWLKEAAMGLVAPKMIQTFSDADLGALLPVVLAQSAHLGITGVNEMLGSPGMSIPRPWIYTQLEKQGKLPLRIHYAVPIFAIEDIVKTVLPLRDSREFNTELVRFIAGKIWVDGAMGNASSWTFASHVDPDSQKETNGIHYFEQGDLDAIVALAENHALPLHFHVNGDKAMDSALQALEKTSIRQGGLRSRHTFIHLGFLDASARQRMKALHLIGAVQPGFWSIPSKVAQDIYGIDVMARAYDFQALIAAGVPLSLGTDWPVVPTRDPRDVMKSGLMDTPQRHALTMAEMINGYTEGSALSAGRRDLGRLDPGFAADLVVFNQNLLDLTDFSGVQPAMSMVAGRVIEPL